MAQTFLLKHTGFLTGRTGHGAIASLVQGSLGTVCWWHPIAGNVNCECRDFQFVTLSCQCTHKVGSRATCQCLPTVGPNNIIHFPAGSAFASGVQALLELVREIL